MLNTGYSKLLKASKDEGWFTKRTTYLRVLQYAGTILMGFSLIALDGKFFGFQISVDQDVLIILLILGITTMFGGYYERRMIEVVRAIKHNE